VGGYPIQMTSERIRKMAGAISETADPANENPKMADIDYGHEKWSFLHS
jgi:hypothetical protein